VKAQILNILGEITGADSEIHEDLNIELFDSGILDSLGMIEILVAIQKELGLQIQPTEVERSEISTPNKIIAFLENKKKNV
jgi:D-alanine--poly(phosphoribitol) ligase subunit 2